VVGEVVVYGTRQRPPDQSDIVDSYSWLSHEGNKR